MLVKTTGNHKPLPQHSERGQRQCTYTEYQEVSAATSPVHIYVQGTEPLQHVLASVGIVKMLSTSQDQAFNHYLLHVSESHCRFLQARTTVLIRCAHFTLTNYDYLSFIELCISTVPFATQMHPGQQASCTSGCQ